VQQDNAEEFLNLMLDEHMPDSRYQKNNIRRFQAAASIRKSWQRIVKLSGVRKNSGGHIAEMIDQRFQT
jgi:hypothetical protein